jgi:flagellar protein FlaJ
MNSYQRFCFNLLGKQVKLRREKYGELRNNLMSARIKTPFEAYLSTAILTSILVGLISAVAIGIITFFFQYPGIGDLSGKFT